LTVYGNASILRSRWALKIGHGYPASPNIFFGKMRKYTTNLPDAHESPRTTFCDKLSKALAEDLAMILADVTRHKADGSILEWVRACYTVRRDTKSWKIVMSEVKPPFLGPGDLTR